MASVIVPTYCGLTGCWQVASVTGRDVQDHPYHACTEHAAQLRAVRARIYAEGRQSLQYWRENWQNYVTRQKFGG